MQVAPMPDKPPFMNGLTAFQVALSFRDMTMRSCGACGDVLRADLGADAFSFATERLSPEPAAAAISHAGLCATSFACGFFGSLWRVEENHGLLTLGESKNENRAFFCRHRETGTRAISRNLREKDHSRRAVRVTIEAPRRARRIRRRVASDSRVVRFPGGTDARSGTRRARSGAHGAVGRSRHREEGRTRATLDSVDRHP